MSDNKKYYYLKVKETFVDSEEMKVLESLPNGLAYQNFYLKVCLLSLKSGGALLFKGAIPYDMMMLSTVLRMNIDTVKTGLELLQKFKLVEVLDNGTIYMSDLQALIGQSSTEGERVKAYRERIKGIECTKDVRTYENRTPELELDTEIDIKQNKKDVKYPEHFLNFYELYPKKKGKDQALKTFNALIKKGIEYEYIISCLENYKNEIERKNTGYDYIKFPSSFLNCLSDYEDTSSQNSYSSIRTNPAPEPEIICCGERYSFNRGFCPQCGKSYDREGKEI